MAITTYGELQTAVANWMARSDLTSVIPDFIRLAEADFHTSVYLHSQETKDSSFAVSSRYTSLPTGCRRVRSATYVASTRLALEYVSPDKSQDWVDASATPTHYTVIGTEIGVLPPPSGSITLELIYWPQISKLSDSNTTSTLLDDHPDLYLFKSLVHAAKYVRNYELANSFEVEYQQALARAVAADQMDAWGGTALRMRVA